MPTVREIAEYANVSKSTVSLVLNNKAGVSDAMREAVLNAVRVLEQQAPIPTNEASRNHRTMLSVLVLHPPIPNSSFVFREMIQGIEAASDAFRVQLRLVANPNPLTSQHAAYLYLTDESLQPDGVLLFGAKHHEPALDLIQSAGIPCVVMGRGAETEGLSMIARDEIACGALLTRHLIAQGHERIGFVGGDSAYDYVHNRQAGYRQALAEAGITMREAWVQLGNGHAATQAILDHAPEVTALVFVNDSHLAHGLEVFSQYEIRIPQDVTVASFDDTPIAREHQPPITSISYDRQAETHAALKLLLDHIHTPSLVNAKLIFAGRLVVRE